MTRPLSTAAVLQSAIGEIREWFERVVEENEQLREKRSTRSKGAQPGHDEHERTALPESEVDAMSRYFPSGRCGCGSAVVPDTEPSCRHQVFDLPEVRYSVTEHQLFGGDCGDCGKRHAARAPQSVPSGQMGPGQIAWIAPMSGEMRLSISQIQSLCTARARTSPIERPIFSDASACTRSTCGTGVPSQRIRQHCNRSGARRAGGPAEQNR